MKTLRLIFIFFAALLCSAATIVIKGPVKHSAAGGGGTIGPISVATANDDAEFHIDQGIYYNNGSSVDGVGWVSTTAFGMCMTRFVLPSAIPSGATITNAVVTLRGRNQFNWVDGTDDILIRATDSADAAAPTTYAARPSIVGGSTATTTAVATWANVTWTTSGVNTSSSIAAVIQELVTDNGGLASGAGIVLWYNTSANYVAFELDEFPASAAVATLTITWTP